MPERMNLQPYFQRISEELKRYTEAKDDAKKAQFLNVAADVTEKALKSMMDEIGRLRGVNTDSPDDTIVPDSLTGDDANGEPS